MGHMLLAAYSKRGNRALLLLLAMHQQWSQPFCFKWTKIGRRAAQVHKACRVLSKSNCWLRNERIGSSFGKNNEMRMRVNEIPTGSH